MDNQQTIFVVRDLTDSQVAFLWDRCEERTADHLKVADLDAEGKAHLDALIALDLLKIEDDRCKPSDLAWRAWHYFRMPSN